MHGEKWSLGRDLQRISRELRERTKTGSAYCFTERKDRSLQKKTCEDSSATPELKKTRAIELDEN